MDWLESLIAQRRATRLEWKTYRHLQRKQEWARAKPAPLRDLLLFGAAWERAHTVMALALLRAFRPRT